MKVTHLNLANVRVIESAEFHFRPGFNLVVGVNGVGKTTVIEALAVSLSEIIQRITKFRIRTESFGSDAIRIGADSMDIECGFQIDGIQGSYRIHQNREGSVPQMEAGKPREQVIVTPDRAEFVEDFLKIPQMSRQLEAKTEFPSTEAEITPSIRDDGSNSLDSDRGGRPLAIFFSTNRAAPSERKPSRVSAAGGLIAAFAGAFSHRELRLGEFAAWIRVQQALSRERPSTTRTLEFLEDTVKRFLPGYENLSLSGNNDQMLLIDQCTTTLPLLFHRNIVTLSVRQLSDGERGLLALVLDLTRRLSQANPEMEDPATEAEAVVLIDEIDLHLHPKWQRQVVHNLTAAFPKCQFIATTHSPQVIGEVESDRIHIIDDGQVYSPTHSFGVDSSRVLEELMDADPRTRNVHELLTRIGDEIDGNRFEQARCSLSSLSDILGEDDPEVVRLRILLDFMEGNK